VIFSPVHCEIQKKVKNTGDWVYWDGTFFMGVTVYTFPSQHAIRQKAEVEVEKNLNQSWLHNLNAEVIIGPLSWMWIVWVVCLESAGIPMAIAVAMPIVRWMAHGNAHHCPKIKEPKKEVNCGLLTENESVCRKDKALSVWRGINSTGFPAQLITGPVFITVTVPHLKSTPN